MEQQKPWQVVLEIAMLSVASSFCLFVWVYIGADDLAAYWEWQWRPLIAISSPCICLTPQGVEALAKCGAGFVELAVAFFPCFPSPLR